MTTTSLAKLFMVDYEDDWRAQAACRGMNPDIFFSPDHFENKQEKEEREAQAKAVCVQCSVREECLDYALKAEERYGIWGGLAEQERRALARRRAGGAKRKHVS